MTISSDKVLKEWSKAYPIIKKWTLLYPTGIPSTCFPAMRIYHKAPPTAKIIPKDPNMLDHLTWMKFTDCIEPNRIHVIWNDGSRYHGINPEIVVEIWKTAHNITTYNFEAEKRYFIESFIATQGVDKNSGKHFLPIDCYYVWLRQLAVKEAHERKLHGYKEPEPELESEHESETPAKVFSKRPAPLKTKEPAAKKAKKISSNTIATNTDEKELAKFYKECNFLREKTYYATDLAEWPTYLKIKDMVSATPIPVFTYDPCGTLRTILVDYVQGISKVKKSQYKDSHPGLSLFKKCNDPQEVSKVLNEITTQGSLKQRNGLLVEILECLYGL
jgi:hypothetical protein